MCQAGSKVRKGGGGGVLKIYEVVQINHGDDTHNKMRPSNPDLCINVDGHLIT